MYQPFNNRPLDQKLLIFILLFSNALSIMLIIENILIDYPFVANNKWFICFIITGILLYFVIRGEKIHLIQTLLFAFFIFLLLPFGWFIAGRSNHFTVIYAFLIYICIALLFQKKLRIFFMVSEIIIVFIMMTLNNYYPELFLSVPNEPYIIDSIVQVFITFFFAGVFLIVFGNAYKKEKEILDQYTKLLDKQNKELERLSMIDELTQIYNRRYIFNFINDFIKKNSDQTLLLGMLDIDHFKSINDTYGHEIGDRVLRAVSDELTSIVGSHGIVGRYGGDEFVIIITENNHNIYGPIVNRIKHFCVKTNEINAPLTISSGFAVYDGALSIDETLSEADSLLYKAKANR